VECRRGFVVIEAAITRRDQETGVDPFAQLQRAKYSLIVGVAAQVNPIDVAAVDPEDDGTAEVSLYADGDVIFPVTAAD
jgi:hypothetical protein